MRQFLSLVLTAGMLVGLMPQSVFADTTAADENQTAIVSEIESVSDDTEDAASEEEVTADDVADDVDAVSDVEEPAASETEEPADVPEDVQEEPAADETVSLTLTNTNGSEGTKPADGTTSGQPFAKGTGNSTNFRIPAMVTLKDGTIVTAADARWNYTADWGGLDTLVSYSEDNGETWKYTYANYLGDNDNVYNEASTAFIDAALATDGETVWMLVDLFPGDIKISNCATGTGFNEDDHLLLSDDDNKTYGYYVGDFVEGTAKVYTTDGKEVSGVTVDAYYNLYQDGEKVSNVFYSGSSLKATKTSYLYLTSSTDGGKTWSEPSFLNTQVKNATDSFYGVGPGQGIVTSSGRIIFPCYTYPGYDGNTSVIYSDDKGATWERGAAVADQTSEATVVEADGRLYMFTRHGGYYVSNDKGETWGSRQTVGVSYDTNCQINASVYSEKIDGKTAILLSAPASNRTNGRIFTGLIQEDGSINWAYTYTVNNSSYTYSVLSELNNGKVALLYEDNASGGSIAFTSYDIATIANGATIGNTSSDENTGDNGGTKGPSKAPENSTASKEQDVTLYVGQTKEITDNTGNYESSYTGEGLDTAIAEVSVAGGTEPGGTTETFEQATSITSGNSYLISDGNGNYLTLSSSGSLSNSTDRTTATKWTIRYYSNYSSYRIEGTVNGTTYYLGVTSSSSGRNTTYSLSVNSSSNFYYTNLWYFNTTNGFSNYNANSYYLRTSNSGTWQVSTTNSRRGKPYVYEIATTEDVDKTDISIKGISEGSTGVQVGDTWYNITVTAAPDYVTPDTTPFTYGSSSKKITKLTTTVGTSVDLNVSGSNVTWSSADTSIATVDQSGNVTGTGIGETEIIATINGVNYKMPVTVLAGPSTSSKRVTYLYVSEVSNTTVYYSLSCSTTLNTVQEGELIYLETDLSSAHAIDFFGDPDSGHALTQMGATNSAGDYFILHTGDHSTIDTGTTGFYAGNYHNTDGAGINQRKIWGNETVQAMLKAAIDAQCDGGMGFTRDASQGNISDIVLTFVSEKLPEVDKSIYQVNGVAYDSETVLKVGDKITFAITVTQHATRFGINYVTSATLTDKMDGGRTAYFQGTSSTTKNILSDLSKNNVEVAPSGDGHSQSEATYTYYVDYTLQDTDLDTTLTNTVRLDYNYKSYYSSGSFSDSADAQATLNIPTFVPQDIVVDFGLPVEIDYSAADAHGKYDLVSGKAAYGTVSVSDDNKVTYTLNKILTAVDTVTLTNTQGATYTFDVYPATTVYYEEGFAKYGSTWNVNGNGSWSATTNKGTAKQSVDFADDEVDKKIDNNNYNYDSAYADNTGNSAGTAAVTSTSSDSLTFTFTGTGVDLFAKGTTALGEVNIRITDSNGSVEKLYTVQVQKNGVYGEMVSGDAYNTPITSIDGLTYGTHTVTVYVAESTEFNFDGFRVYNTINANKDAADGTVEKAAFTAYEKDLEENPSYYELRNRVIQSLKIDTTKSAYAKDLAKTLAQVYTTGEDGNDMGKALALNSVSGYTDAQVQALLDDGPKNELYLTAGQSVTFKLNTNRQVQIGLRALGGSATYTVNGTSNTISSTVDMFYDLHARNTTSGTTYTIAVTNGVLSITDLKVSDSVEGEDIFGTLTEDDIEEALITLGYENEEEDDDSVYENPFVDVKDSDYFYEGVRWAVESGVTSGVDATHFGPRKNVTRGQVVTLLWKAAGSPEPTTTENPFVDVKKTDYFYKAVLWAAEKGITTGVDTTHFAPSKDCTRAQIVTFLWKYAGSPEPTITENPFSDINQYSGYYKAILWAYENKITAGTGDKFGTKDICTRAQTVVLLYHYASL